jgi:hypothetical protein
MIVSKKKQSAVQFDDMRRLIKFSMAVAAGR